MKKSVRAVYTVSKYKKLKTKKVPGRTNALN